MHAVWAGREFRIPSAAVSALPPFRSGCRDSGPSALEALQRARAAAADTIAPAAAARPRRVFAVTPARLPPSRAETEAWLAADRAALAAAAAASKGGAGASAGTACICYLLC